MKSSIFMSGAKLAKSIFVLVVMLPELSVCVVPEGIDNEPVFVNQ